MNRFRKSLAALFAAVLLSALMAIPAFAVQGDPSLNAGTMASGSTTYYTGTNGYYVQGSSSDYFVSGKVTVKVNVHSQLVGSSYIDYHTSVSYGDANTPARTITVSKVLSDVSTLGGVVDFQNYSGNTISQTSSYIYQVEYNDVTYAPTSRYAIDGWMFTVNKKFPLISGTPGNNAQGQAINTTYVVNGDVIDVFWNKADSSTDCAAFDRITSASYSSGTLTVNVAFINSYYDSTYVWNISNYSGLSGATVAVYTSTGAFLGSSTTNASGEAQISVDLDSGTYKIGVTKTWNGFYTGIIHTQEDFVVQ